MRNSRDFKEKIRINIVNFTKADSLFKIGMKPSFWSKIAKEEEDKGWFQTCTNVQYEQSPYKDDIN
jgi:hypothetical protein